MKLIIHNMFVKCSIRKLLVCFILVFTLIPSAILFSMSYYFTTKVITDSYLKNYLNNVHAEFEYNIKSIISQMNLLSLNIITYQNLNLTILNQEMSIEQKQDEISSQLSKFLANNKMIGAVDIVTHDGTVYRYANEPFTIETPKDDFLNQITKSNLVLNNQCVHSGQNFYLMAGKKFYNYYANCDLGYLILYIKEESLHAIYKDSALQQSSFFLTIDNYIISHSDKSQIGSKLFIPPEVFNSEKSTYRYDGNYIISKYNISDPNLGFKIQMVSIFSYDALYKIVGNLNWNIVIILIITVICSIVLSLSISRRLLHEIVDLKSSIEFFAVDPSKPISFNSSNEIYALKNCFHQMTVQIRELIEKNNIEREKQRVAELRALQAQINPHFIYNALDTISWTAKLKKQDDIEEMAYALASFFRISLHKGENIIKVREEIEHIQSYLTIEKLRFPNLFDAKFDIEDNILELDILKIILQPLVENSIKHGFKNINYHGLITVIGHLTLENDIYFEVSDNGIGTNVNPLEQPIKKNNSTNGYGIYNVQERLVLEYGQGFGLFFHSTPGQGTRIEIKIRNNH